MIERLNNPNDRIRDEGAILVQAVFNRESPIKSAPTLGANTVQNEAVGAVFNRESPIKSAPTSGANTAQSEAVEAVFNRDCLFADKISSYPRVFTEVARR